MSTLGDWLRELRPTPTGSRWSAIAAFVFFAILIGSPLARWLFPEVTEVMELLGLVVAVPIFVVAVWFFVWLAAWGVARVLADPGPDQEAPAPRWTFTFATVFTAVVVVFVLARLAFAGALISRT